MPESTLGMRTPLPRIIALGPCGLADLALVVAASRAGALGVLDLALGYDPAAAVAALRAIGRFTDRPFGLRLPADELDWALLEQAPSGLIALIATEARDGDWAGALAIARRSGRAALAEVTSRDSARRAAGAGADALVVAGHEAGGAVGDDSTFILLQAVLAQGGPPAWARGGIGPRSAAACVAMGAAGVVLDGALLLARESPLGELVRERIGRWDGSESVALGRSAGKLWRVHALPNDPVLARLRAVAESGGVEWEQAVRNEIGWGPGRAWPVGQDAALAEGLARRFVSVGGIVQAVERAMDEGPALGHAGRPLSEGSALARSHGTRYPIVQGPMTRVSDRPEFAAAVAEGGALPLLALALMRGPEVRTLLADAAGRLAGRPWGVGLLGFASPELRAEQVAAVTEARPPFALIAGGRPDQAAELERHGISTYLHAPSPALLRHFLDAGSRRFVLEGRECGGHVGPRSSLLLWEQAADVVSAAIDGGIAAEEIHLLFAGGLHDARSAAAVAALAAPLAARGVRVGVLVGTAYLFTAEAVATGAIVPGFQDEALRCARTVLLETGPGHEVRVSPTPFADRFEAERRRLLAEGLPTDEVRDALERLNTGRLRVAAKGVDRGNGRGSPLVSVGPDDQRERGVYMLGQVATLRDHVVTIADLHRELCGDSASGSFTAVDRGADEAEPRPADIAIVGMAALLPGAPDVRAFWENTLRGHDAITEVPPDRWDWRLYYDPDPKAPDKITSKWGGFLGDIPFDPLRYGMPPASLASIEPMQMLTLEVVRAAIDDAGYRDRPFPRERTAVVLGAGGGAAQLAMGYAFRSYLPMLDTVAPGAGREALEAARPYLPEWTEDSFPGILLNVAAGRVANRLDLGGANYTVDAACGSSLAAAALAVRELESGAADVVILGGADTVQNPFTYLAFSKTHAFSPKGRCRPFDSGADGIVISEGVAALVLKRRADAERDGDRIYAVIKGMGASSDGRALGLTAPRPEGQVRALRRAYGRAGVSPATVGYVEAHGTGTAAGDLAELGALREVLTESGAEPRSCAVGSVKSSIGHTKCAAGLAGLINASLALYHRVLPPTIGVDVPNPKVDFAAAPFHISAATRPWLHAEEDVPRRAGVSAFGFGGTNFHAVLESYERDPLPRPAPRRDWPAELLVWRAADRTGLAHILESWRHRLSHGDVSLRDVAHTLALSPGDSAGPVVAIVAADAGDLRAKLDRVIKALADGSEELSDPAGIELAILPKFAGAPVAFLFPGQGAQSPGMLADLAVAFPEVRAAFEECDRALIRSGRPPIGPRAFPPPAFGDAERAEQAAALAASHVSQPAIGAACVGMLRLVRSLGLEAQQYAGHSYGELVALHAAGVVSAASLAKLSEARGRLMIEAAGDDPGAMAALAVGPEGVGAVLDGIDGARPTNWNGPRQTVISGPTAAVDRAIKRAAGMGIRARRLAVSVACHSPLVADAAGPLEALATEAVLNAPGAPVYSNVAADRYPADPAEIARRLGEHLASPVRFAEMVEAMHADGARVFVEVGPGATLAPLVGSILGGRPHLAVSCERPGRLGLVGLLHALARLSAAGVPLRLERLTAGRDARRIDPAERPAPEALSPTTWLVNGARARPAHQPEPPRFGVGPALPARERPAPSRNGFHGSAPKPHANGIPSKPSLPAPMAGSARVVEAFQRTMQAFLDVQRATMLDYLSGRPAAGLSETGGHAAGTEGSQEKVEDQGSWITDLNRRGSDLPPPARPPAPELHSGRVAERLLGLVRERTGYPAEMLRLDLDLEADLGIDSIKRVEILAGLRESLPGLGLDEPGSMDDLSRARTLGAMVERLGRIGSGSTAVAVAVPKSRVAAPPVTRSILEVVEARRSGPVAGLVPGGVVLVTDDGRGIARDVAADLRALGHPVVRVQHGLAQGEVEGVNLTSEAAVSALLDRARERGPLAAIVHALPLRAASSAGLEPSAWSARLGPEVRGLFLLARAAADDLARAADQGGAALIAATAMGGDFAATARADFFPGHGAVAGLVKTLAHEWPGVRARVVDLDPAGDVEVLAADLVQEVLADDSRAEVGYREGRRVALRSVPSPLDGSAGPFIDLSPGDPVVITGGARGITAAVAADLARRWRPTLLLIGSSPLPPEEDEPDVAGLDAPAALKAALHVRLGAAGRAVGPAEVERAYQALRRSREIRSNLRAIRAAGATVEYAQADVRDAAALGRVLAGWRERFGPPVGLIHGAGVIQDKLLRDKTPESFDRVLGTKVEGALTLAQLVEPERLRFAAFFSSVAGRFGNRGQADYAAANEALNKLAVWLDRRWPCRVVSLIWGPWSGVGMVSDLEAHLGRRGLGMIPPDVGRSRLADELRHGRKGDVEVIVAGDLGPLEGRGG